MKSSSTWFSRRARTVLISGSLVLLSICDAASQTVKEFDYPTPNSSAQFLATGVDGAVWYAGFGSGSIGRVALDGTIREFPVGSVGARGISAGPDGAMWFTEFSGNSIGRVSTSGVITQFPLLTPASRPFGITAGPDNNLWFAEGQSDQIGRVTTAGVVTEFSLPSGNGPRVIVAGPDGALWFTEINVGKIGRITTSGSISHFTIPTSGSNPFGIVAGPDGALWFTENGANKIGRITTAGVITEYPVPTASSGPGFITAGPDGAMWFTEATVGKIGRISLAGVVTQEFNVPTAGSNPFGIIAGSDGAIWFTEFSTNKVGRIGPIALTGASPLVASILPTSRSVQVGNTATVFSTIINSGNDPLANCRIQPLTYVSGYFSYQTTSPSTNALTGTPNTAVPLSAHGLQTFVIAERAGASFAPTDTQFTFVCDAIAPAAPISGVNTLQLVFDTNPVADMIAVGVTPSNDGFSHTGGTGGTGIFAVATTNIGLATSLTARARLSDSAMPLVVTLCETNAQGQCRASPSATVSRTFTTNEASTFGIFLQANGSIAANPATERVFLEFVDGGGVVRGSTSTAVTTQ